MTLMRSNAQAHAHALVPSASRGHLATLIVLPVALVALTACGRDDRRVDELLRADLAAASQAPSMRQQFASPQELGYPGAAQGYPTPYGAPPQYGYPAPYGYPQPYPQQYPQGVVYQQPAPAPRVVYRTRPASGGSSGSGAGAGSESGSGAGNGAGSAPTTERNTTRGAVIGAATGAAVGIATSRDKVKGGAVGAVAGAVLGSVVGSQIYTKPRRN